LIGGIIFLFWLNWRLTSIILLGYSPGNADNGLPGTKNPAGLCGGTRSRLAEASAVVDESVAGIRIVKSFAREAYEVARFTDRVEATFRAAMRSGQNIGGTGPNHRFSGPDVNNHHPLVWWV
jgi:subfamily B ATP-binding cassette protein MsbA